MQTSANSISLTDPFIHQISSHPTLRTISKYTKNYSSCLFHVVYTLYLGTLCIRHLRMRYSRNTNFKLQCQLVLYVVPVGTRYSETLPLRTFALIVCAQPFCEGNATVICHESLRFTGPEDKHGVENAWEKNFRPSLLLWIIGDPYFLNHESLTLLTIYKI